MAPNWAQLDTGAGRPVLRFERRLAHPPEKVWQAVTDPAELANWFPARVASAPEAGAPMRFSFTDHDVADTEGEVLAFEPPRLFEFRWDRDVLRFELTPDGTGCRLVFTHTLGEGGFWGGRRLAPRNAAGWDVCLELLSARLDGRAAAASQADWAVRDAHYVEAFGLADGEVRTEGDGFVLSFARDLVRPVAEVWTALVGSPDAPAVGATPPAPCTVAAVPAGPVTAVEAPRLLAYAWEHAGAVAGEVRWTLDDQPVGCWLTLTQTVPAELADVRATALAAWHTHLDRFVAARYDAPPPADRTDELEKRYADRLA